MARTTILPTDPGAVKAYSARVSLDSTKKSYFGSKMTGMEEQKLPIVQKTDLEAGAADEVTLYLIKKLNGRPAQGSEKLEGREMRLSHYTDKLRVDKFRNGVNVGDVMDQKRVHYSIRAQARERLTDYIAEVEDELIMMFAAAARGVGDEIQNFPTDWTAWPNSFETPDADHIVYPGTVSSKATLTANDKVSTALIDKLVAKAKKFIGIAGKGAKMTPVQIEGGSHYVFLMSIEACWDLRRETGETGWFALQKAAAGAEGRNNPIFKGAMGLYNNVLLHEHENVVRFSDYGAGSNVNACRNLFLGAHAVMKAYGFKGNGGVRYQLSESSLDHDEEGVIQYRTILGLKKSRFNGKDFGMMTVDSAFSAL
jgi:N4-gp56 family major capsid protein